MQPSSTRKIPQRVVMGAFFSVFKTNVLDILHAFCDKMKNFAAKCFKALSIFLASTNFHSLNNFPIRP